MKKSKIKMFGTMLVVLGAMMMTVVSALVFSACGTMYHSKAGTMEDMTGTYQLTVYTQRDDDGNDIDRLNQWHVKAYLVVGSDGHGYYAYQDDNTNFWYDSILIQYTKDLENESLYKAIQFTKGVSDTRISYQKPGYGYEPIMGFNVNNKTFNYTISDNRNPRRGVYPSYYTNVVYTKVSDKTDLSSVAEKTNRNLPALMPYELKNLNGALIFTAGQSNDNNVINPQFNKYKYYVVDFDALNQKADFYFELIDGDAGAQVQNDIPLEVNIEKTVVNGYEYNSVSLKLFDQYYVANVSFGSAPRYLNYEVNSQPDEYGTTYQIYGNQLMKYIGDKTNIADIVAEQLAHYNNSHA